MLQDLNIQVRVDECNKVSVNWPDTDGRDGLLTEKDGMSTCLQWMTAGFSSLEQTGNTGYKVRYLYQIEIYRFNNAQNISDIHIPILLNFPVHTYDSISLYFFNYIMPSQEYKNSIFLWSLWCVSATTDL